MVSISSDNGLISFKGVPAKRQFECITCPGGFSCPLGTIHPYDCTVGFYSKPGQEICETCRIGSV